MPDAITPTVQRTEPGIEERRRAPRFDVQTKDMAVLPVTRSVRILDISLSGVLLESAHGARVGTRGRLLMELSGMPFSADVEVRRVQSTPTNDRHRIGAMFLSLSAEHQQMISRFTQR